MGLWDSLTGHAKAQFLDVIQWMEEDHETVVYRFPVFNQAIQDGGKLVVREGQSAVFQSEGKISDSFTPGTYELSTRTKAIWSFFESIKYGLNYPYKGDIFFVNTRQFRDQKWGSPGPFPLRDPKYGLIKLRAFGTYSYRVVDPVKFIREVVGNTGLFTTDEINGDIKRRLFDKFRNLAKAGGVAYEELDCQSEEIGQALKQKLGSELLEDYGVEIVRFTISNVNVDPEDEERIRKVENMDVNMNVFGDRMGQYAQMRQMDMMDTMAAKPSGGGNSMMDAGVGMAMGQMFGNMMNQNMGGMQHGMQPQAAPPPPMSTVYHYNGAAGQGQFSAQDIAQKVAQNRTGSHQVWTQGMAGWMPWNQVAEIANLVPPAPAAPPPMQGASKYFYNDGSDRGEVSVGDIVAAIKGNPAGRHMVWKQGFAGWTEAKEVEEIAALLNAGPPPMSTPPSPPPMSGPPPM